jgi:hypothetical protein
MHAEEATKDIERHFDVYCSCIVMTLLLLLRLLSLLSLLSLLLLQEKKMH